MAKYLKIPILTYEATAHDKYIKSLGLGTEDDSDMDDIDRLIKQSSVGTNVAKPLGIMVYARYPLAAFEGCSYEVSPSLQTLETPWSPKRFDSTMIYLKSNEVITTTLPIQEFEKLMVDNGIVDPDIMEQYPSEKL